MARAKLDQLRSGPTAVTSSGTQTAGSWSLATLMSGNANGDTVYVDVLVACFSAFNYSCLLELTVAVGLSAGPTYSLGSVLVTQLNRASGVATNYDAMFDSITLDQSGGNLRLQVTFTSHTQGFNCYATASTIGP